MSWISATDPLALVELQAGKVPTPAKENGARGGVNLDTTQQAMELGAPVPIVFARRRNGKGGILISPGATEARFTNSLTNEVTARYHLVLSEGEIDSIQVRDVFQRSCRTGTFTQTYDRRAGTWKPGNAIVARDGYAVPECPYYCGTIGAYPGMSTLSFQSGAIPDGFDYWNRQVHCFIRGGMYVLRFEDSAVGPSDSFADLYRWLLTNSSRVPADMIDTTQLAAADLFLRANGFTCNCYITESQNLAELVSRWGPYFLLGQSNSNGLKGLRPVLPATNAGLIDTGAVSVTWAFGEESILPGSLQIEHTSLADRQPFVAQITWRQQLEADIGIIRTTDVRIAGTAAEGPYESHDLSEFCTSEDHAVKVGAYIVAKRVLTSHTIRFAARPGDHSTSITPGDIIRIRLNRNASSAASGVHDHLYQVERISKTLAGDISYECTHFPIDETSASLLAKAVATATGTGILLTSSRTGITCDTNSATDETVPAEEYTEIDWTTDDNPAGEPVTGVDPTNNPFTSNFGGSLGEASLADLQSSYNPGSGNGVPGGGPLTQDPGPSVGDTLSKSIASPGDNCKVVIAYYSVRPNGTLVLRKSEILGGNTTTYTVAPEDEGLELRREIVTVCADFDPETTTESLGTVKPTPPQKLYKWFRWKGTIKTMVSGGAFSTKSYTTNWYSTASYKGRIVLPPTFNTSVYPRGTAPDWTSSADILKTKVSTVVGSFVKIGVVSLSTNSQTIIQESQSAYAGWQYGAFIQSASGKWEFSNNKTTIATEVAFDLPADYYLT